MAFLATFLFSTASSWERVAMACWASSNRRWVLGSRAVEEEGEGEEEGKEEEESEEAEVEAEEEEEEAEEEYDEYAPTSDSSSITLTAAFIFFLPVGVSVPLGVDEPLFPLDVDDEAFFDRVEEKEVLRRGGGRVREELIQL